MCKCRSIKGLTYRYKKSIHYVVIEEVNVTCSRTVNIVPLSQRDGGSKVRQTVMQNQTDDRVRLRRVLPEKAIALAMQNRWSEAADVNRKIIELYPNDADAYNRLGKALMEMGRYRDALGTYKKAVELDPNNIIA